MMHKIDKLMFRILQYVFKSNSMFVDEVLSHLGTRETLVFELVRVVDEFRVLLETVVFFARQEFVEGCEPRCVLCLTIRLRSIVSVAVG